MAVRIQGEFASCVYGHSWFTGVSKGGRRQTTVLSILRVLSTLRILYVIGVSCVSYLSYLYVMSSASATHPAYVSILRNLRVPFIV